MRVFDWLIGIISLLGLCFIVSMCVFQNDRMLSRYADSIKGNGSSIHCNHDFVLRKNGETIYMQCAICGATTKSHFDFVTQ